MTTLTASRERNSWRSVTTILRDEKNRVKKIFNNRLNQPRKNCKTLIINNKKYLIDWSQTEKL